MALSLLIPFPLHPYMISFCTPHHGPFVYISNLCDLNLDSLKKIRNYDCFGWSPYVHGEDAQSQGVCNEDIHDKSVSFLSLAWFSL
jgi:hypothetical protein